MLANTNSVLLVNCKMTLNVKEMKFQYSLETGVWEQQNELKRERKTTFSYTENQEEYFDEETNIT